MIPTDNQQRPLSTQGNEEEQEDQMGGTTNLPLDDLEKEGDPAGSLDENPDSIDNPDDLHEIQVDDDLDEPDADQYEPETTDEEEEGPVVEPDEGYLADDLESDEDDELAADE